MKKLIYILVAVASLACTRHKIIPDDELALIFADAFLANAYKSEYPFNADSLQIYAPIFEKHGFSTEDVEYTVGSFSRRKSSRLSDVVEHAITHIEGRSNAYKLEVQILDSINSKSKHRATKVVYQDSLIELFDRKDSLDMVITLDSLEEGNYHIKFDYLVDSLDKNNISYRTITWTENQPVLTKQQIKEGRTQPKRKMATNYISKHRPNSFKRDIEVDSDDQRLYLQMIEWRGKMREKPHATIKNLEITHTPTTEQAVEKYYQDLLNLRLFADEFFEPIQPLTPQDSEQLPTE